MPKYLVSLTETTYFTSIPVEAENAEEAEKKARIILATTDCGAIDTFVTLSEYDDPGPPGVEEVDDATFAWFLPPKAA